MKSVPVSIPGDPAVDAALARSHGLTDDEYDRIVKLLGRTPTITELGVFSVMWSEHCSYKSSRTHLRRLPMEGPRVVGGPGENAGAIEVGDGWVAVFKIESHNHPSFVEPYQGAATGVGGIIRDIFTMGARPIASMNSLKFGAFDHPRTRYLLAGVVAGIGGYGNCVGVPTVAGEVMFDAAYDANILVNAFCLGLARKEDLQSARARGAGNPVLYVGSATGRDGIHGASLLASAEFDAVSAAKRPTVQVGDPFAEKLLIEACLEAMKTGAIVAIQDMGAAGLSSSSSEMAGRGGLGIELDLDRIPLRERGLTPYEMLLSESQERMLLVAERGREAEVAGVFEKWDLHAPVVGLLTSDGRWRASYRGQVVADLPVHAISDEAPVYDRPAAPPRPAPAPLPKRGAAPPPAPDEALCALLASPNVGSKRWVFRQYDSLVQSNTVAGPGGDAAILRIKGSRRGLALTVDSNPRACALDPYLGAVATVCEAARNLACTERGPPESRIASTTAIPSVPRSCGSSSAGSKGCATRPWPSTFRSSAATSASITRPRGAPFRRRRRLRWSVRSTTSRSIWRPTSSGPATSSSWCGPRPRRSPRANTQRSSAAWAVHSIQSIWHASGGCSKG